LIWLVDWFFFCLAFTTFQCKDIERNGKQQSVQVLGCLCVFDVLFVYLFVCLLLLLGNKYVGDNEGTLDE